MQQQRVFTQVDIEERIVRLNDELETYTEQFADIAEARAEAEAEYKYAFSRGIVEQNGKVPVATKEAIAHLRSPKAYREWKVLEARERATQQKLMAIRTQLDSLRTIAANVRTLTR